jgi:hypothetical protein
MASQPSTNNAALDEHHSEISARRAHKHTLDVDDHSDSAIVGSLRKRGVSSASKDTMGRSTSPSEVNRTKTGRVSKAAKGQPVHHCHCGKTYTRAEHLRRHQQNHKPGAFPCDVPGCVRAFYREDLLTRHKLKHEEPLESVDFLDPHDLGDEPDLLAPSRSPQAPHQSEADLQEVAPVPELSVYEVDPRTSQQQSETGTRKDYIPIAELQPSAIGLAFDHAPVRYDRQPSWGLDPSPFYLYGSGYNTPEQGYQTYGQAYATSTFDAAQSWTTHPPSLYASHSPASRNSTTPTSLGRRPSLVYTQLRTPNSEVSHCDTRNHASFSSDPYLGDASVVDITTIPELRDMLEQDELVTPTTAPQAANFGPNQYRHRVDNEQRYLEGFWRSTHPSWPVIHQPTFDITRASPLLRAAVITLGAHSTGIPIDSANACILHKRCLKVIGKRNIHHSHSYRMEDMQAIFLVELFAIARSLRPPFQLSKPFVDTYQHLAHEYHTDTTNTLFPTIESFNSLYGTPANICPLEVEKTRRLLAACYILDTQHSAFFGRKATQILDFDTATLSLPQPLQSWDMPSTSGFYGETLYEHFVPQLLLPQATMSVQSSNEPFDVFTSLLLLAYTHPKTQEVPPNSSHSAPTPIPTLTSHSNSPHVKLAHQTFALSATIPVHALLAVAGDSWILDEKLGSRAEFAKAQADVRRWATTNATAALPLAIEILRFHRLHPKTTFLFHEWSLHLAVLVVWAKVYADESSVVPKQRLGLEVPSSLGVFSEAVVSGVELDGLFVGFLDGACITWQDAKRLLVWAKGRLEKGGTTRFCRVVSGAVDVLTALGERGDEDGWF